MSFREFWSRLVSRNIGLADDRNVMRITVGELRRIAERAYRDGYEAGLDDAPDDSVFGSLFGKTLNPKK